MRHRLPQPPKPTRPCWRPIAGAPAVAGEGKAVSKTLKDGKEERRKRKEDLPKYARKRPPVKEKGGHKSIREIMEDGG